MKRAAVLLLALMLIGPAPAFAAQPEGPPYEQDMMRLAEILGSVHYLRELCDADEGQTWRSLMQQLLDAENPSPERRARLVESFNRGYNGFQQSYHRCTDTALYIISTYMDEGAELAQKIATRYGR